MPVDLDRKSSWACGTFFESCVTSLTHRGVFYAFRNTHSLVIFPEFFVVAFSAPGCVTFGASTHQQTFEIISGTIAGGLGGKGAGNVFIGSSWLGQFSTHSLTLW